MIVQCPSCLTAYRHAVAVAAASRLAQCGRCETEFPLATGRAYRVVAALPSALPGAVPRSVDPTLGIGLDDPGLAIPLREAAGEAPDVLVAAPSATEMPDAEMPATEMPAASAPRPARERPAPRRRPRRSFHPLTTVSALATIGAAAGYHGPTVTAMTYPAVTWPVATGAATGALLGLLSGWLWLRVSNRRN